MFLQLVETEAHLSDTDWALSSNTIHRNVFGKDATFYMIVSSRVLGG